MTPEEYERLMHAIIFNRRLSIVQYAFIVMLLTIYAR